MGMCLCVNISTRVRRQGLQGSAAQGHGKQRVSWGWAVTKEWLLAQEQHHQCHSCRRPNAATPSHGRQRPWTAPSPLSVMASVSASLPRIKCVPVPRLVGITAASSPDIFWQ